jgi:replicative DNA helicase
VNEASPLAEIQAPHAIDCEEALLGAILHNPAALDGVRGLVDVSDFYQQANAVLFEAMCARRDAGEHIDIKLVKTAVGDQDLGGVTVFQYLARIAAEAATVINAPGYAKAIRDAARMRTIFETARSAIDAMTSGAITDPGEYASWMIQELDSVVTSGQSRSVKRMRLGDSAASVLERVREAQAGRIRKGATFGLPSLDRATLGMRDDQLIIMAGRPGMGKAQPLDAKVHTPHGWRLMGELAVGDIISSIDGAPSSVMGVFDQGVKPVFRIRFSDGRETRCCADHLWEVSYRSWPSARIVSTTQLIELLSKVRYRGRISVRMHSGNIGNCADLPLHPWLLGVILGDGGLTGDSIGVCLPDAAIRDQVSALLPDGYSLSQRSGIDYIIRSETPGRNGVKAALTDLGLMGLRSEEKRIPRCYLDGDRAQRLALLQGLLDTDGWVERQGSVRFSSSSPGLTADVVELCRSLGLWAKSSVKAAYVGSIGAGRVRKLDAHQVCITGPGVAEVFTLERKAERLLSRTWFRSLTIESVTEDGIAPCRCIAVSHPSHLYVTDDHVVTHNTTAALHVAIAAARAGYGTGFISLEMNDIELAERALAGAAYNSRDPISYLSRSSSSRASRSLRLHLAPATSAPALSGRACSSACW